MGERFIPALRFATLTRFYDPLIATVLRESAWKAQLVDQVDLREGMDVLDLGCGTGTLTLMLALNTPGAHIVGVDADPDALERARTKAKEAGATLELIEARAGSLPFDDASFDRVVSSLVFHHLTHDGKCAALAEARRVLRAGGELHIADWGQPHDLVMRAAFLPVQLLDGFETTSDNLRGALPALISAAGFEGVQETRRRRTLFGTLSFIRARRGDSRSTNGSSFTRTSRPSCNVDSEPEPTARITP